MSQFDDESNRIYQEVLIANAAIGVEPKNFNQAEAMFKALLSENDFNSSDTMTGNSTSRPALSLTAYKTNLENIAQELSRGSKGLEFILSQTALSLLNPTLGQGKIANPFAMIFGPPPFMGGITTPFFDVALGSMNPVTNKREDNINNLYKGNVRDFKVDLTIPPASFSAPKTRVPSEDKSGQDVTLEKKYKQINGFNSEKTMSDYAAFDPFSNTNKTTSPSQTGVDVTRPDYSKMFDKRSSGPDFGGQDGGMGAGYQAQLPSAISQNSETYKKYANKQGDGTTHNVDSFFDQQDAEFGYIEDPTAGFLLEGYQVIPFWLNDLRKPERYVAFRAFLKTFSESIDPKWNEETYIGRVDNVATYVGTSRTFDVSFVIAAMSEEGLIAMWKKINNLSKMLYPTFTQGLIDKSPIVRLRIGDVCSDSRGNGLPGRIGTMSINYDDSTWEIAENIKNSGWGFVPQLATISFPFTVIHESNPTNGPNYEFDFRNFRKAGK